MFATAPHWPLSWVRLIQFVSSYRIYSYITAVLIFSSNIRLRLPDWKFLRISQYFHGPPVLLYLIALIIFGEEHKLLNSLLCIYVPHDNDKVTLHLKITAIFWDVTLCSLVETSKCLLLSSCWFLTCLLFDLEAGGSTLLQKVGNFLPDYTPCESQIQLTLNCHKDFKRTSASVAYGIILGTLKIASADTVDEDHITVRLC
jgi:hypothetical protein